MAIRDFQNVVYTDNAGNEFAYKMAADVFAQVGASTDPKVGGRDLAPGDEGLPPMPSNYRPRRVVMRAAGQGERRVVCLTPTADLFATPAVETTLTLPVYNDADGAVFTRVEIIGESKRGKLTGS